MVFADVHYANPGNYKSVLGVAGYSDTIIFNNGVYGLDEPIEVLESWKLFAANPGGAVLRATENIHTLIDVWSSNVVVSGLVIDGNGLANYGIHGNYEGHYAINGSNTIINNKRFGVLLTNTNSVFSNNYVANNGEIGIGLLDSPTSTLSGNQVVGSGYTGIYLYNSPGSSLSGNVVNGNGGHGIFLRLSPYSWIENNVANGNGWTGINLESSGSSAVVTNTANSNHIAGLWLTSTDSTPIIGNTLQYNPYGAVFTGSNGNSFTFNTVTNNAYGVTTPYSNIISNNLIMDNGGWGLNMDTYGNNLNNPTITDNQIYRNGIGIKLVGNNNILGSFLFLNNSVLTNNYALEFTGNGNLLDGTQLFGNTNGMHLIGDNNVLTNLTVVYNTFNGVLIDGNGNRLNESFFLNNTNGLILNGNNNMVNGSGVLNGTNGMQITGTGNIVANNSVSSQNNTAMYINGDNIVTGNSLTDNNGTGLLIRSDNDVVNFLNMLGNTIIRNGQGINIVGNNNHINNILILFNILLDNGYSLTISGNNNQMNSTILTLNKNGLQVIGNNNSFSNITSRFNNQTGIILNGNNNTLNNSLIQNNTNGLIVNGNENRVNSTLIFNSTNGTTINGNNNNLTGNNVHNNTENGLIINGTNNTFVQNNITGNPNAILVENGTNNTLNFNRIAGNTHNLHNNGYGTVDARYNWWGQNNPICITGMNINTNNHVIANLNVPSGTINPGQIYDITVTLKSSTGDELALEIPSFLVQFFINNGGDVYPETAAMNNNSAWTQFVVFNPRSYTLTAVVDQQTLTSTLSTPVNSQPVTPHKIPRKPADPTPNNNLCGAIAVGNLLNSLGAKADANLISQIGGLTDKGISMYGLSQAASYYGINLTGLHLDAGQLKTNDIVLLNINGNNHYALILGKLGDNYIIQDPFLGTVIMTPEQFNKYYTGNALTLNPDGRGTPLSTDEMKNLFGGTGVGQAAGNAFQLAESFFIGFPIKPLAILAAVAAAGIFVGGFIYYYFIDEHVTPKGTGIDGIINDIIGLPSYIASLMPKEVPEKNPDYNVDNFKKYQDDGGIKEVIKGLIPTDPDDDRGIVERLIEGAKNAPWYFKIPAYIVVGSLAFIYAFPAIYAAGGIFLNNIMNRVNTTFSSSGSYTMNNTSFNFKFNNTTNATWNSRLMMINVPGIMNAAGNFAGWVSGKVNEAKAATSGLVDSFKAAAKDAYSKVVQPALDRFNSERAEFQKKGLVNYAQSKYIQVKSYVKEKAYQVKNVYDKHFKPLAQKYIAPAAHKLLDPIVQSKTFKAIRNLPGIKQVADGASWFARGLGIW
ncbi:right-handed parallel beta-helix repeat-containing protein [Methanobacterium sp.]|uniref:right-handed parallel beta-helix repeat-containing protein n=1 Tax=Methanobacterium sp. TaxID=2164 RepID=UPI003D64BCE7